MAGKKQNRKEPPRKLDQLVEKLKDLETDFPADMEDPEEMESYLHDHPELAEAFTSALEEQMDDIMRDISERADRIMEKSKPFPVPPKNTPNSPLSRIVKACSDFNDAHPGKKIRFAWGEKSVSDLLVLLNPKETYDYCKYLLRFDILSEPKERQTEALKEAWYRNPEFLLYTMTGEQMELFASMTDLSGLQKITYGGNLSLFCALCLADFDESSGTLLVAPDLKQILEKLPRESIRKAKKLNKKFDQTFGILLKHYGLLEMDEIPAMLEKYFDFSLEADTCMKMLYWRVSFRRLAQSATTLDDGRHYIAENGLDIGEILPRVQTSDFMADYREIRPVELDNWKQTGDYMDAFAGWPYFYGTAIHSMESKEIAKELCDDMYRMIRNGEKLEACMKFFMGDVPENRQEAARVLSWLLCMLVLMGTSLPGMKGANRLDAQRMPEYGMFLDSYLLENPEDEKELKNSTPVEKMPARLQMQIASLLFHIEEGDLDELREILKQAPSNADLNYIVAYANMRTENHDEAQKYLRKVDKLLKGKDPSIRKFLSVYEDGNVVRVPLVGITDSGLVTFR